MIVSRPRFESGLHDLVIAGRVPRQVWRCLSSGLPPTLLV